MFNKYEVYTTTESIYCYKGTSVLKNKLGITDGDALREAESAVTTVRQYQMLQEPIKGNFSKTHFLNIHRYMFCDIYTFAGKIRREQIAKGSTTFYPPGSIDKELNRVFDFIKSNNRFKEFSSDDFFDALAYVMAELNIIHPFREGNGRTIREFIRLLALNYGIKLNWGNVNKEQILEASMDSVDNYKALIPILIKAAE